MPTYEYECLNCQHRFEEFQSITDEPVSHCPKCSSAQVRRVIGVGMGIIFKGSGFYETDYKKKVSSSDGSSEKKSSGETGKSSKETNP